MKLSIIIPTLNEEQCIGRLIDYLLTSKIEKDNILIADGGSTDKTVEIVRNKGVRTLLSTPSRAIQMNHGASESKGEWLYFIHADTLPPITWLEDLDYLIHNEFEAGTYRSEFIEGPKMLKLNAFFTRFNWLVSRGGDQSLFINKVVFHELGGYDETMEIMEEYPLIEKLMLRGKMKVFRAKTKIATRKYDDRSWLRVSRANYIAFKMYKRGVKSSLIRKRYLELLG